MNAKHRRACLIYRAALASVDEVFAEIAACDSGPYSDSAALLLGINIRTVQRARVYLYKRGQAYKPADEIELRAIEASVAKSSNFKRHGPAFGHKN